MAKTKFFVVEQCNFFSLKMETVLRGAQSLVAKIVEPAHGRHDSCECGKRV
jgi:hypothetical protein